MKQYVKPVIGVVAFLVGGLIAHDQAIEGIEIMQKRFGSKKPTPPAEED